MVKEKRLKRLGIDGENIEDLFTGNIGVVESLPDDATLQRTYEDPAMQKFYFIFQSDEFPVVEEGELIPETDIQVTNRNI